MTFLFSSGSISQSVATISSGFCSLVFPSEDLIDVSRPADDADDNDSVRQWSVVDDKGWELGDLEAAKVMKDGIAGLESLADSR
jgi:hypothetical protein